MTVLAILAALVLLAACVGLAVQTARLRRRLAGAVTERAEAEERLTVAGARRDAILDAAPVPVLVFGADGRLQAWNRAAQRALPGVAAGAAAAELAPGLADAVERCASTRRPVEQELIVEAPERRTYEAHLRAYPVADGGAGVAAVLLDATGTADFREARRVFSAAVSHELRTPLARILGLVETMALPQSKREREALVVQTETEIDSMRRLVDEMLLLASLDRDEAGVAEGVADAGRIAEGVVADRRSRRAQRDRALEVRAGARLLVPVAPRMLEVVIGNLVDNALRHAGPEASIRVSVESVNGDVEILVADTGVGIPPEQLPHVFERFYRGEASRSGPGSGLGLAIVKHVVEAHAGRAEVESAPGRGTTVRLLLPRAAGASG